MPTSSPGTACAVLLDPGTDAMVVAWVDLRTLPAEPGRWGIQLAPEGVVSLIGKRVAQHCLHAGEVLLVGEGDGQAWCIAGQGPFRGRGLVLQYDRIVDAYHSTRFDTLEQVAALVTFEAADAETEDREEAEDEAA